jgi:hypothetical protein
MGSQSVTDFSLAKKKRIRELLKDYSPESPRAGEQASQIGATAAGTLGKGPANEFLQALSSPSVERALGLLMSLADELKENPQRAYQELGVGNEIQQPAGIVSAFLMRALSDILSKSQAETESAFAAKDAIPKTIIDVISRAFPREEEPVEVSRRKFAEAFKKVPREEIVTAFLQNAASALINQVLDATRGRLPPDRIAEVKRSVRERFIPAFIEQLMKGE